MYYLDALTHPHSMIYMDSWFCKEHERSGKSLQAIFMCAHVLGRHNMRSSPDRLAQVLMCLMCLL